MKVGYNLQRKVILLSIWIAVPIILRLIPDFFGLLGDNLVDKGLVYNTTIL